MQNNNDQRRRLQRTQIFFCRMTGSFFRFLLQRGCEEEEGFPLFFRPSFRESRFTEDPVLSAPERTSIGGLCRCWNVAEEKGGLGLQIEWKTKKEEDRAWARLGSVQFPVDSDLTCVQKPNNSKQQCCHLLASISLRSSRSTFPKTLPSVQVLQVPNYFR